MCSVCLYDIFVQLRNFFFFFLVKINSRRVSYAENRRILSILSELVDTLDLSHQQSAQTSPSRLEGTREMN